MTLLYSFDPGTKATGMAVFDKSELKSVVVLEAKSIEQMLIIVSCFSGDHAVVEMPEIYPHAKARSSDVLKVVQIAGAIRAHFTTSTAIAPKRWTGGVPYRVKVDGTWHEIREDRIKALLTPSEWAKVLSVRAAIRHNAVDAVGLGLWHLKRRAK
jgi:hypothetical protein